jgi:diadenosine tetraphosphate (Ap4A) HIT family hydrolase
MMTGSTHFLDHAEKMHELPDENLSDVMPIAKKIAVAQGLENYNILQNNGKIAHQVMNLFRSLRVLMVI